MVFILNFRLSNFVVWLMVCDYINTSDIDPDRITESFSGGTELEKLEVRFLFNIPFNTKIFIQCSDYNSLRYFENQKNHLENLTESRRLQVEFTECFNNATDNENYNYNLMTSFTELFNFKPTKLWGDLQISLDQYAIVDSNVLFNNFNFQKFEDVFFEKVGFKSTEFLSSLNCSACTFHENNQINFNDFANAMGTRYLAVQFNKLLNFNKLNLQKFNSIRELSIMDFDMDDYSIFNTPDLFEHNPDLYDITIEDSKGKITLHERVFSGLDYLNSLTLQDIYLESIPKNLFQDLSNLNSLFLSSNNIKRIDPTTFQNNVRLSFATLTNNPIFTEPQNKIENFTLDNNFKELWLGNFNIHTVNVLGELAKNQKLRKIIFQSLLINPTDLGAFTNFQLDRETPITIRILGDGVDLNLESARSLSFAIKTENQLKSTKLNVVVKLPISDRSFCSNCAMAKEIFSFYLNNYNEKPGIYFERSQTLVFPDISNACNSLEDVFDKEFTENCPSNCNCIYNPLMDKIKIDCNNKNLTEIPSIPYPVQFNNINSIELHFKNNSLSNLSLAHQDENVLKKLSTLVFRNSKIESLKMDYEQAKYVKVIDLCDNPIVSGDKTVQIDGIPTYSGGFDETNCRYGRKYPHAVEYIQDVKSVQLEGLLNELKCK